jgi:anti-sigma regulatory factor (Ser/Thr protein kinase)/anti-anti-sigma regulatory factor
MGARFLPNGGGRTSAAAAPTDGGSKQPKENAMVTKLDATSIDELLRQSNPFTSTTACVFDLGGIKFISPAGLVVLTAACHALSASGRGPVLIINDTGVRSYLSRTAFFSTLDGVATVQPPLLRPLTRAYEHLRGNNPLLIEVTKIASGAALPQLLDQVVDVLRYRLKYKKTEAFDIATAISELAQNTFDHNENTCGFLAMQVYGKVAKKRFLEIAVADCGCGLASTLARNPKNPQITSDVEAIRLAIQRGISEHDDPTRGTGLYHLLEITYKHLGSVQMNGRCPFIASWALSARWDSR